MAIALGVLLAAPLAHAGFSGTDLFLPMVGRQVGVGTSNWYTTVWIHNPGPNVATARIYFLERNLANLNAPWVDVMVEGGDTDAIENIVETLFHKQAFGALRITCPATLTVTSRVFSQGVGAGARDSVGQDFAGVPASFAIGPNDKTQILGVHQTLPADSSEYRFNFGFVETTGHTATVRVTVLGGDGQSQGSSEYLVREYSQKQMAVKDHFPALSTANARLEVQVIAGSGKVIAYGSGIANASQDPTTFEMDYPQRLLAEHAVAAEPIPAGAVMMFDLSVCPAGWTELQTARGRALVGLPAGGAGGGTVGAPLGNLEDRQHTHEVDPAAALSASGGEHSHSVGPVGLSTESGGGHNHAINVPATTTSTVPAHGHLVGATAFETYPAGMHSHLWGSFNGSSKVWSSFDLHGDPTTIVDHGDGLDLSGSGTYPLSQSDALGTTVWYYTDDEPAHYHAGVTPEIATSVASGHAHTVDPASFTSAYVSGHTHHLSLDALESTTAGSHAHAVDLAATASAPAATSVVMPYVQLLVCRKD